MSNHGALVWHWLLDKDKMECTSKLWFTADCQIVSRNKQSSIEIPIQTHTNTQHNESWPILTLCKKKYIYDMHHFSDIAFETQMSS